MYMYVVIQYLWSTGRERERGSKGHVHDACVTAYDIMHHMSELEL